MKALTIREPWATCLVYGPKRIENRSWVPPRTMMGQRIAIHTGVQFTEKERDALHVVGNRIFAHSLKHGVDMSQALNRLATMADLAPRKNQTVEGFGAIIGVATLVECIGGPARALELGQGDWFTGPLAYLLDDVHPVEPPVPVRGRQRFWTVPQAQAVLVDRRAKGRVAA